MNDFESYRHFSTGGGSSWQCVGSLSMPRYKGITEFYKDPEKLMQEGEITFGCLDAPEYLPAGSLVSLSGFDMGLCDVVWRCS